MGFLKISTKIIQVYEDDAKIYIFLKLYCILWCLLSLIANTLILRAKAKMYSHEFADMIPDTQTPAHPQLRTQFPAVYQTKYQKILAALKKILIFSYCNWCKPTCSWKKYLHFFLKYWGFNNRQVVPTGMHDLYQPLSLTDLVTNWDFILFRKKLSKTQCKILCLNFGRKIAQIGRKKCYM